MKETEQTNFAERVGCVVAGHRKRKGLRQDQVAEQLGIGVEAVSRIERGVAIPTLFRLFELADIFECEAGELLMESSPRLTDQTARIATLLEGLSVQDRQLLLNTVEALATRLRGG